MKRTPLRTEDDLPFAVVVGGSVVLVLMMFFFLTFKPVPGAPGRLAGHLAAAVLVAIFGFLFVTVSSRIVGLIGEFVQPGLGDDDRDVDGNVRDLSGERMDCAGFGALAITIGGVVCIAAANAGDTSQDLKTGYILGATPRKQQIALLVGACVSTLAIGATLQLMNRGWRSSTRLRGAGICRFRTAECRWRSNIFTRRRYG